MEQTFEQDMTTQMEINTEFVKKLIDDATRCVDAHDLVAAESSLHMAAYLSSIIDKLEHYPWQA